ncbi:MAG: enoyl-CoA hydratase [Pseudomonadota bacterium]
MTYESILFDLNERIATITLNRPDRLNAWTPQMASEVRDAVETAGNDPEARVIVITGAGRGFCAGADMDALRSIEPDRAANPEDANENRGDQSLGVKFPNAPGPDLGAAYPGRFGYLYACPKPIIAAINGPCAGIGLIMTLYCDMRYTAEEAKFTTAFSQRGLIAEHGLSWLLPRLVGEARALDLLFTARKFLGSEAADLGLVNAAVSGEGLMEHVMGVARYLANDVSPRSVAVMKRQIRKAYHQDFHEALAEADAEMEKSFGTHDFKEGVDSFVERRAAAFKGI